jgi:hypothetical protein
MGQIGNMNKTTITLLSLAITSLFGCTPAATFTQYSPPLNSEMANVELVALDKYRNGDTVRLSIVSRSTCIDKPVIAHVTAVRSGLFATGSIYQSVSKLPALQPLNLSISNVSDSGYVTTHCVETRAAQFGPNKLYRIKVHNWSTPNSSHSGFGCEFYVAEVDNVGIEKTVPLGPPQLPVCSER